MCEQGPIANTDQSQTNFLLILHTFLPNSRYKRRAIRKRLKGQKKKGGKLSVDLVKLAKIAISPVLGKGLAEFEVAFPFCFSFSSSFTIDNFPGSRAGAAWCETACRA